MQVDNEHKSTTVVRDRVRHRRPARVGVVALLVGAFAAVAVACAPPPGSTSLEQVKRTEFGNRALAEADRIAAGTAQPVLEFTVEDTPPSIFVNYVIPDDRAADFESFVDLPPGFSLSKVQILDSDPAPRYWLSLNVYRVSGITTGLRAEWSTYVDDGSGSPKFMIVRARAAEGSVDPIGPLALPEPFTHSVDGAGVISTAMRRTEDRGLGPVLTPFTLFNSTITLPAAADRQFVEPTTEWVAANDFIYWLNGVNDRTFHNSTAHSAKLISVDLADVALDDQTEWAPFVEPVPGHVLVYLDKIQFMIGPWWNVTEPDGRVDPITRSNLLTLKRSMYGGLSTLSALSVLGGTGEPIVQSRVQGSEPSVHWHWKIPPEQLADFAAAAQLPPGLTLAPVRLEDGEVDAAHWLTLNVYRQTSATPGLRAEWSTYVDDGDGIRSVVLEARADHRSLDPVNRFSPPSPLTHVLDAGTVTTTVGSGPTSFSSTFAVPPTGTATEVAASREWVGTSDLRYWSNGIADRIFSDSRPLEPRTSIDPNTVTVSSGGPWAAFADRTPDRVWLDDSGSDQITNPWWNL